MKKTTGAPGSIKGDSFSRFSKLNIERTTIVGVHIPTLSRALPERITVEQKNQTNIMKALNKKNPVLAALIRTARTIVNHCSDKREVAEGRRWLRKFEKARVSAKP